MSECDILKLKKMYECDIDECKDYFETKECEYYKANEMCERNIMKKTCKKTCNYCNVDECKEQSPLLNTKSYVEPKC